MPQSMLRFSRPLCGASASFCQDSPEGVCLSMAAESKEGGGPIMPSPKDIEEAVRTVADILELPYLQKVRLARKGAACLRRRL
jgi:hypothetical protein